MDRKERRGMKFDREYPFILAIGTFVVWIRVAQNFRIISVGPYNKGSDIEGTRLMKKRLQVRMDGSFPIIRRWNQPLALARYRKTLNRI